MTPELSIPCPGCRAPEHQPCPAGESCQERHDHYADVTRIGSRGGGIRQTGHKHRNRRRRGNR